MLHIRSLTHHLGGKILFDQATAGIPDGHRVGLVGRNGAGKSTLLRLIMGDLTPDAGEIAVRQGAKVMMVAQEAPDGPESLIGTVLGSHAELVALEDALATCDDPHRIAELHTRLADIDAHSAPARASSILAGLGFDDDAQKRPCDSFSGGWRMRIALASALFNQPDLLLLDEPTNYLDLEGTIWLDNFLGSYPYTVVIVSHDRDLLNSAVDSILHLNQGKLSLYRGGYDEFEALRFERVRQVDAARRRIDDERRRIHNFVDRFRAKASKAKQAQSRLKMLGRLEPPANLAEAEVPPFYFPKPEPLSPPLVSLEGVSVGYGDGEAVLSDLNLRIDPDDRLALLGQNGNGKSTFAKLLAGRLASREGRIIKSRHLSIGYFAQHQLDELNPRNSAYEHIAPLMEDNTEARIRARLGQFGFTQEKADQPVSTLSGGEKARLMFALATTDNPQLLILDEPTNHLDIDSRQSLIHALNDFDGAILLVSHDRRLLEACADRLWIAEAGNIRRFDGDLDDYKRRLLSDRRATRKNTGSSKPDARRRDRQQAANAREQLTPLRRRTEMVEKELEALEERKSRLRAALASPRLYSEDTGLQAEKIKALQKELAAIETQIEDAEIRWIDAQQTLEARKNAHNSG